jgi:hypothetical protein
MAYQLTFEQRAGYLFVRMEGPECIDSALEFWQEMARIAETSGEKFFLILDMVIGRLNTVQLFQVSEAVARLMSGKVIAYVDPKEQTFADNQFGETVVRNRGGDAKVFTTESDAQEWLEAQIRLDVEPVGKLH